MFWCVFMSATASGTSVRAGTDAHACVFAAAVQGCSKHAGKPVTANQAKGNHPSAQRSKPTIPHFVCLPSTITLDLLFSRTRSFIKAHFHNRSYIVIIFLGGKSQFFFKCFLLLIIICGPGLLVFLNWGLKSINWVKHPSRSEKID